MNWSDLHVAAAPALALCVALGLAALVKAHLLSRLLGAPVNVWRWALVWAAILAPVVGIAATHVPEWAELIFGIPLILGAYCGVIWSKGFGDRKSVVEGKSVSDSVDPGGRRFSKKKKNHTTNN